MLPLLALSCLLPVARGHSEGFGVIAISPLPTDPEEVWAVVDGWGVVHTTDGGARWSWICEEALGSAAYDIAAAPGRAWIATLGGVVLVRDGCDLSRPAGWPEGAWPSQAVISGEAVVVAATGGGQDGLWRCTEEVCSPSLVDAGLLPRSLLADRDGERLWATFVEAESLNATLFTSLDGQKWSPVYQWTGGDLDPWVLLAEGDRLLAWGRPFGDDGVPVLLRSEDGGQSFSTVLEAGLPSDPVPAIIAPPSGGYLLSYWSTPATYASPDGLIWQEAPERPAFRCGATAGERSWIGPLALLDPGWDLATTADGVTFAPAACLDEATSATCAAEVCSPWEGALHDAAALGGERCSPGAPADSGDEPAEEPSAAGGCAGQSGALLLLLPALLARRRGVLASS